MKKLLTVLILISGFVSLVPKDVSAQSFQEEDLVINAGIGFGTTFSTFNSNFGLPIGAGVEYAITSLDTGSIGIGGDIGFVSATGVTMTTFGARGSYYFTEVLELENPKLDTYAGLGLYYRNYSVSGSSVNWGSGVYAAFHVGARYYFTEIIGGYAELGNNWGWLNIGVAIKI